MALSDYCDFGEIREALGVNDIELPDAALALPVYEIGLVRELSKLASALPAAFSTARQASPQDDQDKGLVDAVRLFSAYAVAKQAGASLAMRAPKDVGDGKATLSRWAGTPYEDTMNGVRAQLADARAGLAEAWAAYNSVTLATPTPATFFMASPRASDPVTG